MMRIVSGRSRRSIATKSSAPRREGFALVEIIVAMVLLAVAVSSLAALMYSVSQQGMVATGNAYRNGVLMDQVNRYEGLPYDSVKVGITSTSITAAPYPHTRVVTVTEPIAQTVKTISIIITPTNVKFKPDTVSFTRTKAKTSKVLCTTCIDFAS
ncbi:MAG: type IV pilus modification PilV family protein [Gemmatimonadaceae bacterium]